MAWPLEPQPPELAGNPRPSAAGKALRQKQKPVSTRPTTAGTGRASGNAVTEALRQRQAPRTPAAGRFSCRFANVRGNAVVQLPMQERYQ